MVRLVSLVPPPEPEVHRTALPTREAGGAAEPLSGGDRNPAWRTPTCRIMTAHPRRCLPAPPLAPPSHSDGGRGMLTLDAVADRWGWVRHREGAVRAGR
jgi:hypothetical protein